MYSLRGFFAEGQVCELGGELIDTGHTRIRALAEELARRFERQGYLPRVSHRDIAR